MSNVYSIALGAMNVERKGVGFVSHNIANSGVEGYTRLGVNKETKIINGEVAGVDVQGVVANVDDILQDSLYDKISSDAYQNEIKGYLEKMHNEFGQPGAANTIDSLVNQMQIAFKNLSEGQTSVSKKLEAVESIKNLTRKISSTASTFQNFRFEVDRELGKSIETLNSQLSEAHKNTNIMGVYPKGSLERVNLEDKLRNNLEKIAEHLEITKYNDSSGTCKVLTANGVSIVGDSQFVLKYSPVNSVNELIDDIELQPVLVSYLNSLGEDQRLDKEIISGGTSSNVFSTIKAGKIAALVQLRDKEIPKALEQLDQLAKQLKEEYNKIHNEGSSVGSPSNLSGTTLVGRDQILGFHGKTRMLLVDNQGKQYDNIPALTLDMSKLDTGNGAGKANLEGILQEINYHFGKKLNADNAAYLGDLTDIKLVSLNKELTASSTFDLDLELQNLSSRTSTVTIMNATATDGLGANVLNSFVGTSYNVASGRIERTGTSGPSLRLNIPATINNPITITLDVRANDGVTNKNSQMTFVINNPTPNSFNGLQNHRFSVNTANGDGIVYAPNFVSNMLTASLSAADGTTVHPDSTTKGLIKITSFSDDYHIAIDNLDSSQDGYSASNIIGTQQKFSYFFGLNDLFVRKDSPENWGNTRNTALNLDLRNDIKIDSNKLSAAKLKQIVDYANPSNIINQFEISAGNIENLEAMMALTNKAIFFAQAGTLPATNLSIQDYAAEILGFNSAEVIRISSVADQASLIRKSIQEKIQDLKGVNINEELTNMIIHQQNITANSRVISVAREIDQILMNIIN